MNAIMDKFQKSRHYPDAFDWYELEQSCPTCTQPLHVAAGQEVVFCPNCAIDKKNAHNGRVMLALAKAKEAQRRLAQAQAQKDKGETPL